MATLRKFMYLLFVLGFVVAFSQAPVEASNHLGGPSAEAEYLEVGQTKPWRPGWWVESWENPWSQKCWTFSIWNQLWQGQLAGWFWCKSCCTIWRIWRQLWIWQIRRLIHSVGNNWQKMANKMINIQCWN